MKLLIDRDHEQEMLEIDPSIGLGHGYHFRGLDLTPDVVLFYLLDGVNIKSADVAPDETPRG